jgi:hypothetical protein
MTPLPGYMSTPGTGGSGMDTPGTAGKRRRGRPTKAEAAAKRALIEARTATSGNGEVGTKNDDDDDDDDDEIEEGAEFEGDDQGASKSVESTTKGGVHERLEVKTVGVIDMESGEDMHLDP